MMAALLALSVLVLSDAIYLALQVLAAHGAVLAVGLALGGGIDVLDAVRSFVRGRLHPVDAGAPLLHAVAARLASEPLLAVADGLVVPAVFNLLPVYRVTAGDALLAIALRSAATRRALPGS